MNTRHFYCPLTKLIYNYPVIAEDGFIYEFRAIKNWFETNTVSPISGLNIGKTLIPVNAFVEMIQEFLNEHPELITDQFICNKPVPLFREEFANLLETYKFDELLNFSGFNITEQFGKVTLIEYLCINCKNDSIIKHVIDNSLDLDTLDKNKLKPLFHILRLGSKNLIEFVIKKGIDLNERGANSATVLHYLMKHHSFEDITDIVQFILDKSDITFSVQDGSGIEPFHFLAVHGTCVKLLKFIKPEHCNQLTNTGMLPIQLACQYNSNKEFIKNVITVSNSVELTTDSKTTCELLIYSNDKLSVADKRELVMYYLNTIMQRLVFDDRYYD